MDVIKKVQLKDVEIDNAIAETVFYSLAKHVRPNTWHKQYIEGIATFLGFSKKSIRDALVYLHRNRYVNIKYSPINGLSISDLSLAYSNQVIEYSIDKYYYNIEYWPKKKQANGRLPLNDWRVLRKRIMKLDNKTCVYCGRKATHVDHVIPVSRNGSNEEDNLVAACSDCNLEKSDKLLSSLGWSFLPGSRPYYMTCNGVRVGSYAIEGNQ